MTNHQLDGEASQARDKGKKPGKTRRRAMPDKCAGIVLKVQSIGLGYPNIEANSRRPSTLTAVHNH